MLFGLFLKLLLVLLVRIGCDLEVVLDFLDLDLALNLFQLEDIFVS